MRAQTVDPKEATGPASGVRKRDGVVSAREVSEAPMLSGQALLDARWAFDQVIGHDALLRALATLPAEARDEYEAATPISWVSYSTIRAVHDAYAREAKQPIERLLDRILPLAMERSFKTVWRLLLRLTSDEAIIARTPLLYARTRSRGTMSARLEMPGEGICELTGWASIPSRDIHALTVSVRSFLTLAGRQNVTVVGERTSGGARFRSTWRP